MLFCKKRERRTHAWPLIVYAYVCILFTSLQLARDLIKPCVKKPVASVPPKTFFYVQRKLTSDSLEPISRLQLFIDMKKNGNVYLYVKLMVLKPFGV